MHITCTGYVKNILWLDSVYLDNKNLVLSAHIQCTCTQCPAQEQALVAPLTKKSMY